MTGWYIGLDWSLTRLVLWTGATEAAPSPLWGEGWGEGVTKEHSIAYARIINTLRPMECLQGPRQSPALRVLS